MKNENNKMFFNFLAFISLFLIAVIALINVILPMVGIEIQGTLINILEMVEKFIGLVVIAYFAYPYVKGKNSKGWKIAYIIAMLLFIASIVLLLFR